MTPFDLNTSLTALAFASLGVAGCAGDAPVESAEAESTGGGEAEASCGGTNQSQAANASGDTQATAEAEASCGEGSCG